MLKKKKDKIPNPNQKDRKGISYLGIFKGARQREVLTLL